MVTPNGASGAYVHKLVELVCKKGLVQTTIPPLPLVGSYVTSLPKKQRVARLNHALVNICFEVVSDVELLQKDLHILLLMLAFSIENCNLEVTWLKLKAVNVFLFVCLSNYLFFCFLFFYLFVCLFADLILSFSKLIISDLSSPFSWVLEKLNRLS